MDNNTSTSSNTQQTNTSQTNAPQTNTTPTNTTPTNTTPTNTTPSVSSIVDSQNEILINETTNFNKNYQDYNYNNNDILKLQELIQLEVNKGNKQLLKLYNDQFEIATKTSLVNNINNSINNQHETISLLVVILVLIVLLVIPLVFLILKKINIFTFISIVIIDFVIIGLIISWKYNLLYFKSFFTTFGSDLESTVSTVDNELQNRISNFNNIIKTDLYGSESEFQQKYCCPTQADDIITEILPYVKGSSSYLQPGFYYDDGSSPLQLISPKNTSKNAPQKINWVDYSCNKNNLNAKDDELDMKDDRLVGNTTNTRNL
jgi:hypothetical protein